MSETEFLAPVAEQPPSSSFDAAMQTPIGGFASSIADKGVFYTGAGFALVRFYAMLLDLVAAARRSGALDEGEQEKVLSLLDSAISPQLLGHLGEFLASASEAVGVPLADEITRSLVSALTEEKPALALALIKHAARDVSTDFFEMAVSGNPPLSGALAGLLETAPGQVGLPPADPPIG